jgi:aminoglycoside phosphotransferase (APT) family kinase protein
MPELARSEPSEVQLRNLARFLAANGLHRGEAVALKRFSGGQSNPTYLLETDDARYVLRRKPYGQLLPSAHAIDREYRVQSALVDTPVPVARPLVYCPDASVIGAEFYVSEHVDGNVYWDHRLPNETPDTRTKVFTNLVETLADIHDVNVDATGLKSFGSTSNYVERQLKRWTGQYRQSQADRNEAMESLIDWLARHVPSTPSSVLVHGDYRIDNLIFDRTTFQPKAVLDWEVSTLGDPFADLCYLLLNWRLPQEGFSAVGDLDLTSSGIPDEAEIVSIYCRARRLDGIPHLPFYMAFSLFKLAAILEGIAARARTGTAASDEAAQRGRRAAAVAEMGWSLTQTFGQRVSA